MEYSLAANAQRGDEVRCVANLAERASEHIVPRQALKRVLLVSPACCVSRVALDMTPCGSTCRFGCVQVESCAENDNLQMGI